MRGKVNQCFYCGLEHPKVEAGGVWHCPNALCTGPGAAYFRSKLKSYREEPNDRYSVDSDELVTAALALANASTTEPVIAAKIRADVGKWVPSGARAEEPT